MAYGYKYRPSKAAAQDFAKKMREIEAFCLKNNISSSLTKDSYYFNLNGKNYRVSNHSVEASNNGAYNWLGEKVRDVYHPYGRDPETVYIHASKTRIIEIYNALKEGKKLDGRGRIVENHC